MTTVRSDQLAGVDLALNGVTYMIEWRARDLFGRKPYDLIAPDLVLESRDLVENLSDNKLDRLRWGTNRSWHDGAGQKRLNQPEVSSPNAFLRSEGCEIFEKGQLTLLPAVTRVLALTNIEPAPQKLTVNDSYAYVAAGQPNLKRFANLDASDVASVSTGTETSLETYDLASDGGLIYIGLAADGIHRFGVSVETERESFSNAGDFTVSGPATSSDGTFAPGIYTLEYQGSTTSNTTSGVKTFGSAQDYSAVDQFKIKYVVSLGVASALTYRLITSSGNYFQRSLAVVAGESLVEDTANRTTDFTSVGTPSWSNITQIEVRMTYVSEDHVTTYWDNFRSVVASSASHWCDWDARVLGWAKDRIYAAGIKTGTQWRFFEADALATSSEVYVLPDGWEVTDISELQGYVYFSAKRGRRGLVYAYDGENAPFVAVQMPPGVQALHLSPFSGGGMLIGARKLGSTSSGGLGVLYRAFPTASGHLSRERILTVGEDDGKDYGIRTGVEFSEDVVHFGIRQVGEDAAGLGVYLPETGGWTRGLEASVGRTITDSIMFKGRRIFTADGDGVWVEGTLSVTTGEVVSSAVDLNTASKKSWLAQESTFAPLVAGQTVAHDYSTDGGTVWLNTATASAAGATRLRSSRNFQSETVHFRVTLGTNGASPTLYSTGLGGWPATKPGTVHQVVIRAYPAQKHRTGETRDEQDYGYETLAALLALHDAATVVDYQPPWWVASQETLQVRISAVQFEGDWGTTGRRQGGAILVELTEVA